MQLVSLASCFVLQNNLKWKYKDLREVLDENRVIAKKEKREFIIDEMLHVLDEYDEYKLQNKNIRSTDEER